MKNEDKKKTISKLLEFELRQNLLIPLLKSMGYNCVYEHHGANEKGKDINFTEVNKFGDTILNTMVVTIKDITGNVSDSNSSHRILEQIEKSLNESYTDKYTGAVQTPDRCVVVTSGKIKNTAIESISGKLNKYNLNKLVKFIDADRLVELLDVHYPIFWEPKKEFVHVSKFETIEITPEKLDPPYDLDEYTLISNNDIVELVHDMKKTIYSLLLDWDYEIQTKFIIILKSKNPWEILTAWEDATSSIRDNYIYLGSGLGKMHSLWQMLLQDIREIDEKYLNKDSA